jgi:putative addiction module killer protein
MTEVRETETFKSWMKALKDSNAQVRILARIRRLSLGNVGDAKPVGEGVSELRIDYGPGYRVYFTRIGREIAVFLVGGDKSTQSKDIATAKAIAKGLEA